MQDIGTADTFNTKIPGVDDPADIRDALKMYHYGSTTAPSSYADITAGVAYHLKKLSISIAKFFGRPSSSISRRGSILVLTGDSETIVDGDPATSDSYARYDFLPLPTLNGLEYVLTADSDSSNLLGLKWSTSSKDEEAIKHIMGVF